MPSGTNAYETYLKNPATGPGNGKARQGLKQIVLKYYDKANRSYKRNKYDNASKFVKTGLMVAPEHKSLLALKQKIERKMSKSTQASVAPPQCKSHSTTDAGCDSHRKSYSYTS